MDYTIRQVTENDIESLNSALDSVARERKYLSFLEGPSLDMSRAFIGDLIARGLPYYVAEADGNIVGWCDIQVDPQQATAHSGTLGIGIIASHRGYGIGPALMQACLDKAREIGLTRVQLTVREDNHPAIALYQKLGFVQEGVHVNAVRVDGVYTDMLSMALLFE